LCRPRRLFGWPDERRFCRPLLEESRGEILRWASIDSVADRLEMDQEKAALAAELDEQGMVRVRGGHRWRLAGLTRNGAGSG
jgi:hypothetical protein